MTINENNYIGANTTLVGYVSVDPRYPAYDKEGKRGFKQIPIALNEGYKPKDGDFVKTGVTWYDVEVKEEWLDDNYVGKGDKIRVDDAKQEVRSYKDRNDEVKLGITLKYGTITVLESAQSDDGYGDSGNDYSDGLPF